MKHFIIATIVSLQMILMPIQAQTPPQSEEIKKQEELAKLNENAENGKNERGQKLKPGYLEMLMLISVGMVAVTSPIPQRTDRAKNDCMASFSGPVSLILLKMMAIFHIMGEAKAFFKYSSLSKKVTNLQTSEMNKVSLGEEKKEQALLDFQKTYETYQELYRGQKEVIESKKNFYNAMKTALKTAIALEGTLLAGCTGICISRNITFDYQIKAVDKAIQAYLGALEGALTTLTSAYAVAPYTPVLTRSSIVVLRNAISQYQLNVFNVLNNNKTDAKTMITKYKLKEVSGWTDLMELWNITLKGTLSGEKLNSGFEKISGPVVIAAEETQERTDMVLNESRSLSIKTATAALARTIDSTEMTILTQLGLDQVAANAACTATAAATLGASAAPCYTAVNTASAVFTTTYTSWKEGTRTIFLTMRGFDEVIDTTENVLANTIGKRVESMEKLLGEKIMGLNQTIQNLEPENAKLLEDKIKLLKQQSIKGFYGFAPYIEEYERILNKKSTCCGSQGRLNQEPTRQMPIPAIPGGLRARRDLKQPKQKIAFNDKWMNDVVKMALYNYEFEENNRKPTKVRPRKNQAQIAKAFYHDLRAAVNNLNKIFGIPEVQADSDFEKKLDKFAPSMGLTGIMVAFKFRKYVKKIYDFATKSPQNRLLFFGVLNFLNEKLIDHGKTRTDEIDKNIETLTKLIEKTEEASKDSNSISTNLLDPSNSNPYVNSQIAPMPGDSTIKPFECANVGEDSLTPTNCPASQNPNLGMNRPEFKQLQTNFPEFASAINNIGGLSSNIATSNNGQAFSNANLNSMNNQYAAMRKKAQTALAQIDQIESPEDKKSNSLKKMMDDTLNSFQSAGIGDQSNSSSNMMASLAPPSSLNNDKKDSPTDPQGAVVFPANTGLDTGLSPTAGFGVSDQPTEELPADASQQAAGLDQFEVPVNDIIKEKDKSIFEALSDRYLLSYPKILKKAEPTPAGM